MLLKPNDHILFYGDSITDCNRRVATFDNYGLGTGYPALIASTLLSERTDLNLLISNRGFSGNRISDLECHLESDVVPLAPTVVSILAGINDVWHVFKHDKPSPLPEFAASYRRVLERFRAIGAKIVLCEPFLLPIPDDRKQWREDFDRRILIIRQLATEFADRYVPLDGLFAAAACRQSAEFWLPDGVHPSPAGHGLIARHWLAAVLE